MSVNTSPISLQIPAEPARNSELRLNMYIPPGPLALLSLFLLAILFFSVIPLSFRDLPEDSRPNIILVVADDIGYHDVGFLGSKIRTPNLDHLVSEGVRLDNYYVQPASSPTRSQLMSGRYQTRTGILRDILPAQPYGLPLDSPTLAQVLKDAGYSTHMVGKWHLGFYRPDYLPNNRGFQTFYGSLTDTQGYFSHKRSGYLDLYDNLIPDFKQNGQYSAHLFTRKASDIILKHNRGRGPLFLYLAYQSVGEPLEVPESYMKPYIEIYKDHNRTIYAGMVTCMDEGIGNLTEALKIAGLWNNTVFVFSSDNGGDPNYGGVTYPLRGFKGSLWEGGIRGLGFVSGPLLKNKGHVSSELMHVSDWFPTLAGLAQVSLDQAITLDGFDQWKTISEQAPTLRKEILYEINTLREPIGTCRFTDTFDHRFRAAIRVGNHKLITGDPGNDSWINLPYYADSADDSQQFSQVTLPPVVVGNQKNIWLFNINEDFDERDDLSDKNPTLVQEILKRLQFYNSTMVPPINPPEDPQAADPGKRGGVWGPWKK